MGKQRFTVPTDLLAKALRPSRRFLKAMRRIEGIHKENVELLHKSELDGANHRLAKAVNDGAPALEVSRLEAIRNRIGAFIAESR